MYIAKYYLDKKIDYIKTFAIIFIPISIIHLYLSYKMSLGFVWYKLSSIGQVLYVALAIAIIYCLSKKINNKKIDKIVDLINPHTFNIFLYHILVMNGIQFCIYSNVNLSVKYKFVINCVIVIGGMFGYCLLRKLMKKNVKLLNWIYRIFILKQLFLKIDLYII